jgi:cyclic pyranopterin phosphate synthase
MSEKIIMLADARVPAMAIPSTLEAPTGLLADALGRPLHDLRISVTDRCNFRCVYCMPKEVFDKNYAYLPHSSLLSFEEITRVARLFVAHGVEKIRLTGGEPLLRKDLERLVAQLRALQTPVGPSARPDPHHQRLAAGAQGARSRTPAWTASRCRSTPSTTPCSSA